MNKGKFVFAQVVDFLPRYEFDKIVKKYGGDYRYRHLTSYNHLLHLIFGQLSACNSLRDICLCLGAHKTWLYHLGFGQSVNEYSLSENAVKIHLWVAVITYLLVSIIRAKINSPYTITEVETLLRNSTFERMNLRDLLTKPAEDFIDQNQNVKELSLF